MNYQGTLIAVENIDKAKEFYHSLLGLEVIVDAGVHVQMTGGLSLQTVDTWADFINKKETDVVLENNAIELYFETDDMDGFVAMLEAREDIVYLHPLIEHEWGDKERSASMIWISTLLRWPRVLRWWSKASLILGLRLKKPLSERVWTFNTSKIFWTNLRKEILHECAISLFELKSFEVLLTVRLFTCYDNYERRLI